MQIEVENGVMVINMKNKIDEPSSNYRQGCFYSLFTNKLGKGKNVLLPSYG